MDIRIVGGVACLILGMLLLASGLYGIVNTKPVCEGGNETGTCSAQPSGSMTDMIIGLGLGGIVVIFGGVLLMWYYDDYRKKGMEG